MTAHYIHFGTKPMVKKFFSGLFHPFLDNLGITIHWDIEKQALITGQKPIA
jgi:hypothetical protein